MNELDGASEQHSSNIDPSQDILGVKWCSFATGREKTREQSGHHRLPVAFLAGTLLWIFGLHRRRLGRKVPLPG